MNELERIKHLEDKVGDMEKIIDKLCNNTGVCGYTDESREHREHEGESPLDKFKKGL